MKRGKLFKITSALIATILVVVSVLIYNDKSVVNASNNVTNEDETIDNQVKSAIDSVEEVVVRGKSDSKTYTMNVQGEKITYNVTETATGRKIVQTNDNNNEYTEVNLDNGILSVVTGEILDGKYVAKKSHVCNIEEEAKKAEVEENTATSNRVSCMTFGKSFWYEKNDTNFNFGKSRFGSDLVRKTTQLNNLNNDEIKNVEKYQNYVDKSAKNWNDAKNNLKKDGKVAYVGTQFFMVQCTLAFIMVATSGPITVACTIATCVLSYLMYGVYVPVAALGTLFTAKCIGNSVKALYNGYKAQKAYNKIEYIGKEY